MIKIVIDTNVLISAALSPQGNPAKIMKLISEDVKEDIQIYLHPAILQEYSHVLAYKRLNIPETAQEKVLAAIQEIGIMVDAAPSKIARPDESDRIFYDTAKACKAYLVTGNKKHYPNESFICTPAQFVDLLITRNENPHPGNADIYLPSTVEEMADSPLRGKTIAFLGSSVTEGSAALGHSPAEYLARRFGAGALVEAVGGTRLADSLTDSYVRRIRRIDTAARVDLFVCQLSTNDASAGEPLGKVSTGFAPEAFDTATVIGAIEYIIAYARDTWRCPVMFYTGSRFESPAYVAMVKALFEIADTNPCLKHEHMSEDFRAVARSGREA